MDEKAKKLQAKTDKAEAAFREARRKQREHAKSEAEKARDADTNRKVLQGVTAEYGCARSEVYRKLHEQFQLEALTKNKDREVFGLPPLSDEERDQLIAMRNAGASSAPSDSFEEAPAFSPGSGPAPARFGHREATESSRETEAA